VSPTKIVRISGLILASLWAGFWTWFCASVAASERGQSIAWASGIIAIAWAVTAVAWWRPRWGGVALVGAGIFAALFFQGVWAWALMALPAAAAGLLLLASTRPGRARLTPA
jgi:hypothetical protein